MPLASVCSSIVPPVMNTRRGATSATSSPCASTVILVEVFLTDEFLEVADHPIAVILRDHVHGLAKVAAVHLRADRQSRRPRTAPSAGRPPPRAPPFCPSGKNRRRRAVWRPHPGRSQEIVDRLAQAPRPRHEHAPLVGLRAHLAFVHQSDDALRQARGVVRLHGAGVVHCITPALGQGQVFQPRGGGGRARQGDKAGRWAKVNRRSTAASPSVRALAASACAVVTAD